MNDARVAPATHGTVRQFEGITRCDELVIGRTVQPLECSLGMPSKTLVSVTNGIAHDDHAPFAAKRHIEAKAPLSPPTSILARRVPRLVWESRGDSTFARRVERNTPEGISVIE